MSRRSKESRPIASESSGDVLAQSGVEALGSVVRGVACDVQYISCNPVVEESPGLRARRGGPEIDFVRAQDRSFVEL